MTGDWTPQRVLDAAAAWVWVPPDAVDHDLGVYRLTYYPDRTSVQWSRSERPAAELVDEVLAKVRADGRTSLRWWVNDATRPADTERHLLAGGFVLVETVEVLAWELGDAATPRLPRLDVPRDVTVRPVTDEAGGRRGVRGCRGRGAYRALLDARMRRAHELGATLALVKGRVGTSGPILRRAGFTAYGRERCYQLTGLSGPTRQADGAP